MSQKVDLGNLKIEIQESPKEAVYVFKGDVDEHFRQKDVPRVKRASIVFELADVANFNSVGIREWIYLVRDIGELGTLKFRRCSVTMVDQINMVPDSLGKGTIESFFAPYYCSCDVKEVSRLIETNDHAAELAAKTAPEFNCESCGKKLEFDALEESYFLFADTAMPQAS